MVDKSVLLACSVGRAFDLFTAHVSEWWPVTHRRSKDPASRIHLLESGRFYEAAPDGSEFEMGRVKSWEQPDRIVLDFYLGTAPDAPTEVTITFTAEGSGTRVDVRHRPGAASEELWNSRAPVFARSWDAVLPALAELS
ncbi:MAG: SRPBCC domain-containing protein [Bryobacteraceae bacterium]